MASYKNGKDITERSVYYMHLPTNQLVAEYNATRSVPLSRPLSREILINDMLKIEFGEDVVEQHCLEGDRSKAQLVEAQRSLLQSLPKRKRKFSR